MHELISVLLVDDHPPLRAGIRALLEQDPAITVVAEAINGATALRHIAELQPTVTVLDCELPDMEGAAVSEAVAEHGYQTKVLALSAFDHLEYIQTMLSAGAKGYLLKSETAERIVSAVHTIAAGGTFFSASILPQLTAAMTQPKAPSIAPTPREQEVLQHLAAGLTNAQIAAKLTITERTVAYHVENLLNKLGVNNRTEAVVEAIRRGWLVV